MVFFVHKRRPVNNTPTPTEPPPNGWSSVLIDGGVRTIVSSQTEYTSTTSTFKISHTGGEIWNTVDHTRAWSYDVGATDDFTLIAWVFAMTQNVAGEPQFPKAGPMFRASNDANSAMIYPNLIGANGTRVTQRLTTGASANNASNPDTNLISTPVAFKIERDASLGSVKCFYDKTPSSPGSEVWVEIDQQFPLWAASGTAFKALLAATPNDAADAGLFADAEFTNVSVSTAAVDHSSPSSVVGFNPTTYNVNEDAGTVTLTVTRSGAGSGALTLNWSLSNGTAIAGTDYTNNSGSLSWTDSETGNKTFNVTILDRDAENQGNNSFNASLNISLGTDNITQPSATVTIIDQDVGSPSTYWPAQDSVVGYTTPAVRNRNPSGQVVSAGRGYGMGTRHAYGGGSDPTIYHVENGSQLKTAMEATGPRIVVFDKGGTYTTGQIIVTSPNLWVAGQSAPDPVMVKNTGGQPLKIQASDIFMQHIGWWHESTDPSASRDTFELRGGTQNDIVLDHCFLGGGTDGTNDMSYGERITLIDCLIALGQSGVAPTSRNHAFAALHGQNTDSADALNYVSLVGNVFAFFQRRQPLVRPVNYSICNHLMYGLEVNNGKSPAWIECVTRSNNDAFFRNFVGIRAVKGPNSPNTRPILILSSAPSIPASAELYLNDNIDDTYYSTDEWDIVLDQQDVEANIRVNSLITASWPEGLVAAPCRALSKADYITLLTRNVGPFPSSRITFLQNVIDDIVAGTGGLSDTYTLPSPSVSTTTFVPVSNPHGAGTVDSNRTRLEEQLLDLAEGLLV